MLQVSTDGTSFPTGSVNYIYGPAHEQDKSSRIILQVEIEGLKTLAVLDTGGIYLVCSPEIGRALKLDPYSRQGSIAMSNIVQLREENHKGTKSTKVSSFSLCSLWFKFLFRS